MKSIKIDIIDPKAVLLLENLAEMNLIAIKEDSKEELNEILKRLRSKAKFAPDLAEITEEVEKVRTNRYERKASKSNY